MEAVRSERRALELPALTADLSAQIAQSAEVTQQAAANYELRAERDAAAAKAAKQAKADLAEAKKSKAKKTAEKARRDAAAQAASRTSERTTLAASVDTGSATSSSTATGSAAAVIAFARAQIGDAYALGATSPNSWDSSSLLQAAFKQAGVSLPRAWQDQSTAGTPGLVEQSQARRHPLPGQRGQRVPHGVLRRCEYHTALYVGDGKFVGAENPSTGIAEKPLTWGPPTGAVRVL